MRLENEFTVDAPPERVWTGLLDIERVASCLPGATIEPGDGDLHRGSMRVKLGPMVTTYEGTARLADVDEDTRSASIEVKAKEARGQGTASATITNRLEPANGAGTRVVAVTDLQVTGRQAQFGRGIMQDVAAALLSEFASRFERELLRDPGDDTARGGSASDEPSADRPAAAAARGASPTGIPSSAGGEAPRRAADGGGAQGGAAHDRAGRGAAAEAADDVLDAGPLLAGMARRYVVAAAALGVAALALAVAGALRRRRRSSVTLRFDHRW